MKGKKQFFLLVTLCVSLFLRVYKINQVPASLGPDEVALGYNAFSILHNGVDEHGKVLPLSFLSFGDGKLPVYIYLDTIFVGIMGLSELAVKIPSVISGVFATFLIYHISCLLFKKKSIGLLSSLLYAVSPWSIYFSRMAYEANLATTLFLGGIYFFLLGLEQHKEKLLIISSVFFSLTIFTYHSYVLFTPLMLIALVFYNRKNIHKNITTFFSGGVFVLFLILGYFSIFSLSFLKASNLSLFQNKNIIYNRVESLRGDQALESNLFKKIIHNKYSGVSYQIIQNYLVSFSPSFLFDKGGQKLIHNSGSFGNLYTVEALFLIAGISALFWNKEKYIPFLFIWTILGPLPSAITEDTPNTARLITIMPLLILISSYGCYASVSYLIKQKTAGKILSGVLILLFAINFIYFFDNYFIHMNYHRARFFQYGFREAAFISQKYPEYDVEVKGPENFPYVYFLFYSAIDVRKFKDTVRYYPQTKEGFLFVKEFDRYSFVESIDYTKLKQKTIYFDSTRLDDKKNSIFLPSGEPILGYYISH